MSTTPNLTGPVRHLSMRIPEALVERAEAIAADRRWPRNTALVAAIEEGLPTLEGAA